MNNNELSFYSEGYEKNNNEKIDPYNGIRDVYSVVEEDFYNFHRLPEESTDITERTFQRISQEASYNFFINLTDDEINKIKESNFNKQLFERAKNFELFVGEELYNFCYDLTEEELNKLNELLQKVIKREEEKLIQLKEEIKNSEEPQLNILQSNEKLTKKEVRDCTLILKAVSKRLKEIK